MPISGFQRHAFMWASCHDTDQRLMFSKNTPVPETEAALEPVRSPKASWGWRFAKCRASGRDSNALSDGPRSRFGRQRPGVQSPMEFDTVVVDMASARNSGSS
jgi:hypothetical protein